MTQRALSGEYKLVIHVGPSGTAACYLLHLPSRTSAYGNSLLAKYEFGLTDQELLDGDWGGLIERAGYLAQHAL